ncbi:hypothetical protein TNCV_4490951 [Trichonephila clavipes]|nr:hypothetical protein TNCV_4490951 [Trichonephila clavipes]
MNRNIHFRRKTNFFPEEDTTKSYSGFEPESTRLQADGHSHHTGWATIVLTMVTFAGVVIGRDYESLSHRRPPSSCRGGMHVKYEEVILLLM